MPAYIWLCEPCQERQTKWESVANCKVMPNCPKCGGPTERDYTSEHRGHVPGGVFPYITTNITGEPVEVRSHAHLKELCKLHGKVLRDDPSYVNEELRTTLEADKEGILRWKHRYQEGSSGAYESGRKWF